MCVARDTVGAARVSDPNANDGRMEGDPCPPIKETSLAHVDGARTTEKEEIGWTDVVYEW